VSNIARSLGTQRSGSPRDQARESLRRILSVVYDKGNSLSDESANALQGLVGSLISAAEVRIVRVLITDSAWNLYSLAKRNGGGPGDNRIPICGVSEDNFEITGGSRFGDDQWMIHGKINSTDQEATLFIDRENEDIKELVIYLNEESS
jgi:hypothetical protein